MGSTPWPSTLRIKPHSYEAGPIYSVTRQKARDLSEYRLLNGESWGARFTVPVVGSTERSALVNFFNARKGSWDSFPFTAPDDSVTRQCTFTHDQLVGRRLSSAVWEYDVEIVEV